MVNAMISANLYQKFLFFTEGCNKGAAQYELKSFVTIATYWVPDLPNIKGISGHLLATCWNNLVIGLWKLPFFSNGKVGNVEHPVSPSKVHNKEGPAT